jgi:hypothetical protein
VSLPTAPFEAEGVPAVHSTIEPGHSITITVKFAPSTVGTFNGEIALGTSAGTGVVRLSGSAGLPGKLQIVSEENDFGPVLLGSHATRTFTVANVGGTTVTVNKSKPPSGGAFSATTSLPEGTTIGPGEELTEEVVFTPKAIGSTEGVETTAASLIGKTGATLNATVDPNGEVVSDCHFDYGQTTSYGASASCAELPGSVDTAVAVSTAIGSLSPETTYHFRIVATNGTGTSYGAANQVTTARQGPTVATGGAASIGQTISLTQQIPGLGVSPFEVAEAAALTHLRLSGTSLSAGGAGTIEAKVSCPTGVTRCTGTLTLRTLTAVPASGPSHGSSRKATILTLASGSFTLLGGRMSSVKLHLSARGRELLSRKHVLRARAIIVAHGTAATTHTTQTIVTIRRAKPKRGSKG